MVVINTPLAPPGSEFIWAAPNPKLRATATHTHTNLEVKQALEANSGELRVEAFEVLQMSERCPVDIVVGAILPQVGIDEIRRKGSA